jgi:hypothetical protein
MGTLLSILDFVVLLLLVVLVLFTVWRELSRGSGSLVLSICVSLVLIIFGTVSFAAYLGLVEVSSLLTRVIFLVVLLGMAGLLRLAWAGKPAA